MTYHGDVILRRLPQGSVTGAEVGVAAGELSRYLMARRFDLTLYMVDDWRLRGPKDPYRLQCAYVGDDNGMRSQDQLDREHESAQVIARKFNGRIIRAASLDAAKIVPDSSLDFAYIDADHRYEACLADIGAWWPKVKPGGWIGGHDFARFRDGGVQRAVITFADEHDVEIETDECWTWFVRVGGGQ